MEEKLVMELLLSHPEVIEEPPCAESLSGGGFYDPEILSDPNIITNPHGIEPSDPFLSDKLTVGHKAINAVRTGQSHEAFHNLLPLLPIGVASLRQQFEYQREGNSLVGDAEHEVIDVEISELPVGAVHTENKAVFYRQQTEYHPCDDVEIQGIVGKESLEAPQIGILLNRSGQGTGQFMEADSLHHAEGGEKERHQFDACQIHCFSKMLLHNREDLVNFDQVLGISSSHGEKSANFSFKLLSSRDLLQILPIEN